MPAEFPISRGLRRQYRRARTVQELYIFWYDYFGAVLPDGLAVYAPGDLSDGNRKELRIITWIGHKVFFSGLVHDSRDSHAEEVAGDEAYTRVGNEEYWDLFRFFIASNKIAFFKGDMGTGDWRSQGSFDPIHEAQEIHDYFAGRLAGMQRQGLLD